MARKLLSILVWPVTALFAVTFLVTGWQHDLWIPAIATLPTLLLVVLYALERVIPGEPGGDSHGDPQRWNDIGHLVLGGGAGEILGNNFVRLAAAGIAATLPAAVDVWPHAWPMAAQVALLLLGAELLEYARHRLAHRVPLLWRVHELHHSGDQLNVLKSPRNHVLELLLRTAMVYTPLVLLGAPATWIPIYAGAVIVFGPLSHANLDLRLPRWLHYVVGTPDVHRLHHARDPRYADCNYSTLPFIDLLFGSFVHPEGHGRPAAGVHRDDAPTGFVAQLVEPFRPRHPAPPEVRVARAA